MLKKLRRLFSLEERLSSDLQNRLNTANADMAEYFKSVDSRVGGYAAMQDKFAAEVRKRLSRIEVLLEDELKAKEQLSIQKIKDANGR